MTNTKRYLLIKARKQKRWTQVKTAMCIGIDAITLSRWENGKITPRPSMIDKICHVFGMTASELGLENDTTCGDLSHPTPQSPLQTIPINNLTARLFAPIVTTVHVSPHDLCQLQAKISATLEEANLMETNYPNYHITRREALAFLAALPQIRLGNDAGNLIKPSMTEPVLKECAAGITACEQLSWGSYDDMAQAYQTVSSYLPALETIVQHSSRYRSTAAQLVYQCLHIKSALSYHFEGTKQEIVYAERAVMYAKESGIRTLYISSLRHLSTAYYEDHNYAQALLAGKRAVSLLEQSGPPVSPLVKSWVYAGLAKYQAKEKESGAIQSLKLAYMTFSQETDQQVEEQYIYSLHTKTNLLRQDALARLYSREPGQALQTFGHILDFNHEQVKPKLIVPLRLYGQIVNEATVASLKVPNSEKDKEVSIRLWKSGMQVVKELRSEKHFQEAITVYDTMESIWPDESDVLDLRDLMVHW